MSLAAGQPKIRFGSHFNPGDISAIAYVPKVVTFEKDLSGTSTDIIFAAPAGTLITRADAVCTESSASTDVTLEVGLDGNVDALIDASDFSMSTVGNWATNVGSTVADNPNGLYIAAADNVVITVTGTTVTDGHAQVSLHILEFGDMFGTGKTHVDV